MKLFMTLVSRTQVYALVDIKDVPRTRLVPAHCNQRICWRCGTPPYAALGPAA